VCFLGILAHQIHPSPRLTSFFLLLLSSDQLNRTTTSARHLPGFVGWPDCVPHCKVCFTDITSWPGGRILICDSIPSTRSRTSICTFTVFVIGLVFLTPPACDSLANQQHWLLCSPLASRRHRSSSMSLALDIPGGRLIPRKIEVAQWPAKTNLHVLQPECRRRKDPTLHNSGQPSPTRAPFQQGHPYANGPR
jgi:hypothetical protein